MSTFREFERAGWEDPEVCGAYHDRLGGLVAQAVEPLLDAGRVGPADLVLDVATGAGLVAVAAAGRGAEVVGVDFSAEQLRRAREHPEIAFVRADDDALPITAAAVDVVVSSFGVPHFPDPEAFFRESWRVLRAAGRLAFTVWAPPDRGTAIAAVFDALARHGTLDVGLPAEPDLFRYADPAGATRSLAAAGFVDVSTMVVPLIWELPGVDAVVDALLQGTVRIRALLTRQPAGVLARVREAVREELAGSVEGGVVRVPRPAVVVHATKP